MTFKKGQSGNPGGHKERKLLQLRELLLPYVQEAIDVIVSDLKKKNRQSSAAREILDRVFGKASQAVELSGEVTTINVTIKPKTK